jgi:hypothetical protein
MQTSALAKFLGQLSELPEAAVMRVQKSFWTADQERKKKEESLENMVRNLK